jgi:hypothetical protein
MGAFGGRRRGICWSWRGGPGDALALCNLGAVLGQGGKAEEAIVTLKEAIRLKPDLAGAESDARKNACYRI